MTTITNVTDGESSILPTLSRVYVVTKLEDNEKSIKAFTERYKRTPKEVWVWRNKMYIPLEKGEK